MACLFCGKEIGTFRLLRDKEFCSSAHRQGYSARLGKALGRISADQPPPAPLANFMPCKPFLGNNITLSQVFTLKRQNPEIRLLNSWPLAIPPVSRDRAASLSVSPQALLVEDFSAETQPWTVAASLSHLTVELEPEPWSDFNESPEELDPVAAGPALLEVPAADWMPDAASLPEPAWEPFEVQFPETTRPVRISTPSLCGAGPSLTAEPVEAFLPPSPLPEMVAFAAPIAAPMRLALRAADWEIVARMAEPMTAPAAEAVESFLPPPAEPQIISWPATAALPQLQLLATDWLAATAMAEAATAPAAEAVESLLPAPAEPQIIAWPATAALPQLQLLATDWLAATAMARAATAPAAEAVESFLPAAPEPQIIAWPATAALPQLQLFAIDWLTATAVAEAATAPGAEVVEAFLPPPAEPQIIAWPATAALPQLQLFAIDWLTATAVAEAETAPAAEAVESLLPPPAEPNVVTWPAVATALPHLTLGPAAWRLSVELAEFVAAPAAEAVESFLPAAPEAQIVSWPAGAAVLPRLALAPTDWVLTGDLAGVANTPSAEAVESFLPAAPEPCALPLIAALRLPELALIAIAPEPAEEFVPPVVIANASESWMASPPACEVVREVIPAFAGALPAVIELAAPALVVQAIEPTIRWMGDWRQSASADPVISFITPHLETALPVGFSATVREASAIETTPIQRTQNLAAIAAEQYPAAVEPRKAEVPAIAAAYQQSDSAASTLQLPKFTVEHTTGNRGAAFQPGAPSAVQPAAPAVNPGAVTPQLDRASSIRSPQTPAPVLRCGFPLASPKGTDLICQQTPMPPVKALKTIDCTSAPVLGPKFVVRPIFERIEEAAPAPKPVEKTPAFAEIFEISKAARKTSSSRRGLFSAGKLIAASLIVGISMWFGAGSVKMSRQLLSVNNNMRSSTSTSSDTDTVASAQSPKSSTQKPPSGPIASVRHAIQNRAAVELSDTFRRMEAWGSSAASMPAGWSRHPDGYVHTGQLALYRPAQNFSDYRFEFFGEIEKKGMSWAIRAKDTENYYGMKMAVIEPGLRPVVAMVHYAVVGGKKLQRVETPLSIMMHNNEPYHVAVEVKGNKVITSIEGQEVDSWTNDALKMGGVGFLSEAGESARLYWMRVSKNQDWLGRVCAYLSSGSGTNTADLWREELPHTPTQPSEPTLPPSADVTVAAAEEIEEYSEIGPQRARILKIGRTELCRS